MKKLFRKIFSAILLLSLFACSTENPVDPDATLPQTDAIYQKSAFPPEEKLVYYNGALTRQGETLFGLGYDGSAAVLSSVDLTTGDATRETLPEAAFMNVADFAVTENGCYILKRLYNPDSASWSYEIHRIKNGELLSQTSLDAYISVSYAHNCEKTLVAQGNTICVAAANQLATFSDGETTRYSLPSDMISLCAADSGEVYVIGKNYFCVYDPRTGNFAEDAKKSQEIAALNADDYYVGADYDLYYSNKNGLYGYSFGADAPTWLFRWSQIGIYYSSDVRVFPVNARKILVYGAAEQNGTKNIALLSPSEEPTTERKIVSVSYIENGRGTIPNAATKFNSMQTEYEIVPIEYLSAQNKDYATALDQRALDVATGNLADVLVFDSTEDLEKYGTQGALADLYDCMESKDDYFQCVLDYCEIDGKLYGIPGEFSVQTLLARTENLPEYTVWNSAAFLDAVDSRTAGQHIFFSASRSVVENWALPSLIGEFIDARQGVCSFDSEEFIRVMRFIKSFAETYREAFEDKKNHFVSDEILFARESVSSISDWLRLRVLFGLDAPVRNVGFPSDDGGGVILVPAQLYSVNSAAKEPEGAWKFIQFLLSDEVVVNRAKGTMQFIPSAKESLAAWEELEDGTYYFFPYDSINRISSKSSPFENLDEGVQFQINAATYQEFSEWVNALNPLKPTPQAVQEIVREELSVFYSDGRSAEDSARIIQSRVGIYLSENG